MGEVYSYDRVERDSLEAIEAVILLLRSGEGMNFRNAYGHVSKGLDDLLREMYLSNTRGVAVWGYTTLERVEALELPA